MPIPGTRSVSCIICAFNEEMTIAAVLDAVRGVTSISEVIVVDDGSTDETPEVVRGIPDVRLITLPINSGKTVALTTGIANATGDLILTLDADLTGLTAGATNALLEPVMEGRTAVSLSLRANSLAVYRAFGLDFVSGERVFPKSLLKPHLERMKALPRWGAEVFMNSLITQNNLSISVVRWPSVRNRRKTDKLGAWPGIRAELAMTFDILDVLSPATVIRQNIKMQRLCAGGLPGVSKRVSESLRPELLPI